MRRCDPLIRSEEVDTRFQDSDDSENEGGLANVNRAVMRPPEHSGKAKRGHLCFDASFETGNLGRVDYISDQEYDLFIRPDTCNPRHRFWFNFTVDNTRQDQRVIFNIVNFSKTRTLYRNGLTPLVKSTSRPVWQRVPLKYVFHHRSAEHSGGPVLSFIFCFDREDDVFQFSVCFPYSYSRLQMYLTDLQQLQLPYMQVSTLACSVQQRECPIVTIGPAVDSSTKPTPSVKTVVILARSHPGESPTSYIVQGLMELLASDHPVALQLKKHVVIKIIPMLNPDGVFLGNERCSAIGADLNRVWDNTSEWAHPTLHALQILLTSLDQSGGLELVLDLHAHNSTLGCAVYGNTYEDVYRYERHIVLPKMLNQCLEEFSTGNTMYNRDPVKSGTVRRFLCSSLSDSVNAYTIQVSMYGYQGKQGKTVIPYTEEGYMRVGRCLARSILDYCIAVQLIQPVNAKRPGRTAERPKPRQQLAASTNGDQESRGGQTTYTEDTVRPERGSTGPGSTATTSHRRGFPDPSTHRQGFLDPSTHRQGSPDPSSGSDHSDPLRVLLDRRQDSVPPTLSDTVQQSPVEVTGGAQSSPTAGAAVNEVAEGTRRRDGRAGLVQITPASVRLSYRYLQLGKFPAAPRKRTRRRRRKKRRPAATEESVDGTIAPDSRTRWRTPGAAGLPSAPEFRPFCSPPPLTDYCRPALQTDYRSPALQTVAGVRLSVLDICAVTRGGKTAGAPRMRRQPTVQRRSMDRQV